MKTLSLIFGSFFCFGSVTANIGTQGFHEFSNNPYFVETGSFGGFGIEKALEAGFSHILSIDFDKNHIEFCKARFNHLSKVKLFIGDSGRELGKMIAKINEPITFWLDAHTYPPVENSKNTPLFEELNHIAAHPIKTHTILIDDMNCCGSLAFDYITKEKIIKKIQEINPHYQFKYLPGGDADEVPNNVLVAYISQIDTLIAPEIKNDEFYRAIYNLSKTENIETVLEIGSSDGGGSTEAFVKGILENPNKPTLFCMEVSQVRYQSLKDRYISIPSVQCYNVSSVPLRDFPTEQEIRTFHQANLTSLSSHNLETVVRWLYQDIHYVKNSNVIQNGIDLIKAENNLANFDMVLIDGSEFTGKAEFALVYGAKFILLDDINAFKNYHNYLTLSADPNYTLIEENWGLRNGYAIFKRME